MTSDDRSRAAVWQRLLRFRYLMGVFVLLGGASLAEPVVSPPVYRADSASAGAETGDLSVLTYNVKGLPWPLASGRPIALRRIGLRLAQLRAAHRQPDVVVLQEAFTEHAKAIARLSGYAYFVEGAYTRAAPTDAQRAGRNRFLGETQPALVDSGLMILTDLPVLAVARAPFPPLACAGWDCLAAKGVALVTLDVPGKGPITVATVHLNCQGASGAATPRATEAFERQVRFLAEYLATERQRGAPLIVAGDFNRGNRPHRAAALQAAVARLARVSAQVRAPADALSDVLAKGGDTRADLRYIHARGRDLQYSFAGGNREAVPIAAEVPFGIETDGSMLSDHMGYTIRYRLEPRARLTHELAGPLNLDVASPHRRNIPAPSAARPQAMGVS